MNRDDVGDEEWDAVLGRQTQEGGADDEDGYEHRQARG